MKTDIVHAVVGICGVVLMATRQVAFAADPGGCPGFVKAVFTGSACDTTSDVFANAKSRVFVPDKMYTSSCLPEKTTAAYGAYMYMEKGVRYDFKGRYDDFVTVKIGATWVLTKGNECQERTGSYTPTATDWYKIDLRVANNGGEGGCQSDSQYGILWKVATESTWNKFFGEIDRFKTGEVSTSLKLEANKPVVVINSAQMRASDPTVMDVEYRVYSSSDTVNVRAVAFEDGERSFWKVVRATTFVKDPDGNETACNIGDGIAANVPHKLAWKVAADWKTDLAKVKFEVLCSEQAQLPLKLQTIPATAQNPAMTIGYGSQTDEDIFNALLWYYADGDSQLVNDNGYVRASGVACVGGTRWVDRTNISGERMDILKWLYAKIGYEPLIGGNLMDYVRKATRKDLWWNTGTQNCIIQTNTKPTNLYVGEKAYCVIDVSNGSDAASYPITYLDTEPVNGWGTEYKTTKILLRRCEAGKYIMGAAFPGPSSFDTPGGATSLKGKEVTLTKPFYMGVFPISQKQYQQVMGVNPTPSEHQGSLRPVEVSWNAIRGDATVHRWPTVRTVDSNTFVGKIQSKTGLNFDLPTEAQWEYACRAGTDSKYGNGGGNDNDLRLLGHVWSISSVNIGLYVPNFWGVYDMHGNVGQWCLDYYNGCNSDPAVDYVGAKSGSARAIRAYLRLGDYSSATSFCRYGYTPDSNCRYLDSSGSGNTYLGFRLARTLAE